MTEETILQSKVPPAYSGKTLLEYLSDRFRYQDAEGWGRCIRDRKVAVNGHPAGPRHPVHRGDLISYRARLKEPPVDRDILFLHEEKTFLVAFKPGQLPSHADGNFIKNTFIHILTERLRAGGWKGDVKMVHRLDRETSGLMVVAKGPEAHKKLTAQFENGTVEKEYLAVAKGSIPEVSFEVVGAIGKDPESAISVKQKVVPEGTLYSKSSKTVFEKIEDLDGCALLRCIPKTGRTNQIRVHLDFIGHPIVGDKLYGRSDEEFLEFIRHVKAGGDPAWSGHLETARHMLHASKLAFLHPVTGERVVFESLMPADMENYVKSKRSTTA